MATEAPAENLVSLSVASNEIRSYEATSSRRSRSLAKEIATAAVASVFLGFGSLFVLLAIGVYV